jgi:signal transduction histidine kinase
LAFLHIALEVGSIMSLQHLSTKKRPLLPNTALIDALERHAGRYVVSKVVDISEPKRTDKERLDLGARLIAAQEEERAHISRELHDDVGQRVALLTIELQELAQQSAEVAPEQAKRLERLLENAKGIAFAIHQLSHKLHPVVLSMVGLRAAIRGVCSDMERQGLAVKFTAQNIPSPLPNDVSLCLFRIAQEALNNVRKHSGAKEVQVEIVGGTDSVRMRIADSGRGFDPKSSRFHAGLGLLSMNERVQLVGGTFSVKSWPSEGTEIEVQVPVCEQSSAVWADHPSYDL